MSKNKEAIDFNKLPNEAIKLSLKKSFEIISNVFETHIYTKLCIVEEFIIPDELSKSIFDKLLADIFNAFKQNDPSFSEKLKITIEELVLETLETMCKDAINYILAKVNPIYGLPLVTKIFKTKIIVNNKIIQPTTKFKSFKKQPFSTNKKHILLSENKGNLYTKIKRSIGNNLGKINAFSNEENSFNKIKLDHFKEWYSSANFHKMQILNGSFNLIDRVNQQIQKIDKNEWQGKGIIELKKNIYEFTTQLGKSFYELFAEFDDKKDKHGNFTQFQTKTTKKILKTFQEIQTLEFCMPITNDAKIFIQPIHIKAIVTSRQKIYITLWIDTNILLLQNFNVEKMSFFVVMSKEEMLKLKNLWYKYLTIMKKSDPGGWTFFHDYRLNQFIDLIIKSHNFFQCNYYEGISKDYFVPVQISKDTWNDLILPEKRLDEHLRRNIHYRGSSARIDTIQTKKKIRQRIYNHIFKIFEKSNYLTNPPKLIKDNLKFRLNPNKFNPTQAQNKILLLKK